MSEEGDAAWLHDAAKRIEKNGNGVGLSYGTVSLFLGLLGSIIFGAWSVNQSQLANISSNVELVRRDTADKASILASELSHSIGIIQSELDRGRNEFAHVKEFGEFKARVLDDINVLRAQLSILEQTRPTTGELSAVSLYVKEQTARLEERVRQLEQNQIFHMDKK